MQEEYLAKQYDPESAFVSDGVATHDPAEREKWSR